jgi:ferredoxin-fold anticodon binding domain-containing protein
MHLTSLQEIQNNETLRKRLAKWMAHFSFRNTKLESFHDRFSQDEMKELMIDVVNHSYLFLSILFATDKSDEIIATLESEDQLPQWNEPEIPDGWKDAAKNFDQLLHPLRH